MGHDLHGIRVPEVCSTGRKYVQILPWWDLTSTTLLSSLSEARVYLQDNRYASTFQPWRIRVTVLLQTFVCKDKSHIGADERLDSSVAATLPMLKSRQKEWYQKNGHVRIIFFRGRVLTNVATKRWNVALYYVKHATKRRRSNHIKSTAALTNPMNILKTNSSVQLRRPDRLGQRH